MSRKAKPDLLDRRARVAAAHMLMAFDLPAEAMLASKQMLQAAKVCPGITIYELPQYHSRRAMLERARELIDELLA